MNKKIVMNLLRNICHTQCLQAKRKINLTTGLAILLLIGCASVPAPTEQIAASKTAVDKALSAGSNEFAPLQLKSALDKMESAERAMGEKNYVLARQLAEQAEIDAQLAQVMARTGKAQKAAGALQESSRVLRQEIDRQVQ
jgi:hypothetical protein